MARDVDMIPYAGSRTFRIVDASGTNSVATANRFTLDVKNTLVTAGWSVLSDTLDGSGRHIYILLSQQSPWWSDEVSPPASYIGKVELSIIPQGSNTNIGFYGRDASHNFAVAPTAGVTLPIGSFTGPPTYTIVATKYSGVILRSGSGSLGANVMFGAFNTPRFLQERTLVDNWYCFECNAFRTGLQLAAGQSGLHYQDSFLTSRIDGTGLGSGRAYIKSLWNNNLTNTGGAAMVTGFPNLILDPTLADSTKWIPNLSPAEFHVVTVGGTGVPLARGWPWDMVVLGLTNSVVDGRVTLPDGHIMQAIRTGNIDNGAGLYVCVAGTDLP